MYQNQNPLGSSEHIGGNMVALSTWKWGGIPSGFKLKGLRRQKCKHGDRYKNLMTQQNNS
ncbi:hypothetical protein QQP08_004811 [Theobroma cacao]|nr:hypothetical protein QQP08_004811 [Theobroma cacao]